jgi:uncharacterized protein
MTILFLVLLFVVLFMVFVSLVVLVIGPIMLLQPYRRMTDYYRKRTTIIHPSDLQLPYEEIMLKTAEGFPLSCWLIIPRQPARGTVIIIHGVSESKIVGLPMAKLLHEAGFNVLLYDLRRHGESGGYCCTYGFYEKHDTTTIINYLVSRKDFPVGRIGLLGNSMGAAIAIQVAAIDKRVAAVVAESGFGSLRTVLDEYQKRIVKLPWHYLRNIVIKRSEHIAHFRAALVAPVKSIKDVHVPVFILHGTADQNIHVASSQMLYEAANDPKELWLIPGATHSNVAEVAGESYGKRIVEFFEKWLP